MGKIEQEHEQGELDAEPPFWFRTDERHRDPMFWAEVLKDPAKYCFTPVQAATLSAHYLSPRVQQRTPEEASAEAVGFDDADDADHWFKLQGVEAAQAAT